MRNKRSEIERRMRTMAKAKVDMLMGVYQWPPNIPPINKDGSPRFSERELLRVGGYVPTYKDAKNRLFQDPYFLTQVRTEVVRREKRLGVVVPYNINRVVTIRDLIFDELETRLTNDPGSFTRSELLGAAEKFELLSRMAKPASANGPENKMSQFNAFISRTVNVMTESERESLVDTASQAADERVAALQKMIDEVNILEGEADELDVIDAEISPITP
jgi:hypothetical protein